MSSSLGDELCDVIVIGGGTAGLTVTTRLAEDPSLHVVVLEAGHDARDDPNILTPGLALGLPGNPQYDWDFVTEPQVRAVC